MQKTRMLVACALLVACGPLGACATRTDEATPELREGTVHVTSQHDTTLEITVLEPIKLGKNDLLVSFGGRPGSELFTASALMPAHGHGSMPPLVERTGEGTYRVRDLVLYMSGRWEVRFALRVDGVDDEALVTVDVP